VRTRAFVCSPIAAGAADVLAGAGEGVVTGALTTTGAAGGDGLAADAATPLSVVPPVSSALFSRVLRGVVFVAVGCGACASDGGTTTVGVLAAAAGAGAPSAPLAEMFDCGAAPFGLPLAVVSGTAAPAPVFVVEGPLVGSGAVSEVFVFVFVFVFGLRLVPRVPSLNACESAFTSPEAFKIEGVPLADCGTPLVRPPVASAATPTLPFPFPPKAPSVALGAAVGPLVVSVPEFEPAGAVWLPGVPSAPGSELSALLAPDPLAGAGGGFCGAFTGIGTDAVASRSAAKGSEVLAVDACTRCKDANEGVAEGVALTSDAILGTVETPAVEMRQWPLPATGGPAWLRRQLP
jgi:hypothetical protein